MTPTEIMALADSSGVRVRVVDGQIIAGPKGAVSEELRKLIRENKDALVAHVAAVAHAADYERRRKKVLKILADNPKAERAVLTEDDAADPVVVTVAVRGKGTLEVLIPKAKYDGFALMELTACGKKSPELAVIDCHEPEAA